VPPLYNLLSIGVTVVRPEDDRYVIGESYYSELRPIFPGFDKAALAVCGLDVERLRREGEEPEDAMRKLSDWVSRQNRPSSDYPVFVGHNAVFDWTYIAYYFAHFKQTNPFGYKGIDTKSLAMGRLGISWNDTSKENLERLLELPAQDPAQVHRADYDAWYQGLILQRLLERRPA
jgi:DNA polymerase III epsilon subunit-like protein